MFHIIKEIIPPIILLVGFLFAIIGLTNKQRWTLLFIIPFFPLRNVVYKLHPYPCGKDFIDILLISLLLGLIFNATRQRNGRVFEKSPLNAIAFITIIYTYISLWRGYFTLGYFAPFDLSDERLQFWKNYSIFPILYFLTFNIIKDKKWIWRTIVVMSLTMVVMDYYQLMQLSWFSNIASRSKVNGTFVYLGPNEIAAFYSQYTIILMSLFFVMRSKLLKFILGGLIWVNIYCIAFLFSRAAYISLVVGCFFLFAARRRFLLIPLICVVIFWQTLLPQKVKDRINMTTNQYGELDVSSEMRIIIWEQSLNLFKDSPVLGIGLKTFKYMGFALGDTHNIYVKFLVEQGIIGFLLFLILIWKMFRLGWQLYKNGDDPPAKALGLGFAICIVVLLVNNMFGDRWSYLPLSAYLWIFAGLVARLNTLSNQPNMNKKEILMKEKERIKRMYGIDIK